MMGTFAAVPQSGDGTRRTSRTRRTSGLKDSLQWWSVHQGHCDLGSGAGRGEQVIGDPTQPRGRRPGSQLAARQLEARQLGSSSGWKQGCEQIVKFIQALKTPPKKETKQMPPWGAAAELL